MSKPKKGPLVNNTPIEKETAKNDSFEETHIKIETIVEKNNRPIFKQLLFGSLIVMLVTFLFSGYNVGYNSDEIDLVALGKANWHFYTSFGKDTSYLGTPGTVNSVDKVWPVMRYYGNGFESLVTGFTMATGIDKTTQLFNVRHIFNQLFAILGILFTALATRKIADWRAALISSWILFFTPMYFGQTLYDVKDIPFYAGWVSTFYFSLCILEELPKLTWKTVVYFVLACAFTINSRIAGVMHFFFLGLAIAARVVTDKGFLAECRAVMKPLAIKLGVAILGSLSIAILTWPFLLTSPIAHILEALDTAKNFPQLILLNFEGNTIDSKHVPTDYLPKFIVWTVPIVIQVFVVAGVGIYFNNGRRYNWRTGALILVTFLLPLVIAIANQMPVYNAWRHLLFIYGGLVIFAAIGVNHVMSLLNKPAFQYAVPVVFLAGLSGPISFSIKNHPYEYVYFNEFVGGFKETYYDFDNEYWQASIPESVEWLVLHEHFENLKDTIIVSSNAPGVVGDYLKRHHPKLKLRATSTGFTGRHGLPWQYAIYNTLFIKPFILRSTYPPGGVIHTTSIDDKPVCVVIRDTARLDYKAIDALKRAEHKLGDSLFTAYVKYTGNQPQTILAYWAVAKASMNQVDEALVFADKAYNMHYNNILDYNALCAKGIAYGNKGEYDKSLELLREAKGLMPSEQMADDIYNQIMRVKGGQLKGIPTPPGSIR